MLEALRPRSSLLSLLLATLAAHPASAQMRPATVGELLAKNLAARGGAQRLRALASLRLTGKIRLGSGDAPVEAAWALLRKRPGLYRQEVTLQGLTAVDAYDGREGWSFRPFGGRRDPQRASHDEARSLAQDADITGPLVDWREKGHRIEYLGTEDVDGTQAHKLRVLLKDGDVQYVFLDDETFLEIRVVAERHVRGAEQITETDLGNYAQVGGVFVPFSIASGRKGGKKTSRITVEQAEADVAAETGIFAYPAPGATVARAVFAAPPSEANAPPLPPSRGQPARFDAGVLSGLGARNIGSAAMSGRISAIAARNVKGKTLVYVGAASGGVWKSLDGGTTFKPVFDKQPVQSVGAIALDPSDEKTVWVGTGESWMRNSVSVGDGIYRSTDGGESWTNLGLRESEHIARILVHPKDPSTVYACVPGKLWSDSPDRGLYKTSDAGKSWSLVLRGPNLSTGCASVTMDPRAPNVLVASLWDFRRKGWTFRSGGEGPEAPSGSGLFRTADGGRTWREIPAGARGLPPKPWGRVEIAIAPSSPRIVYAVIEAAKDSALYRSQDGGATWEPRDRSQSMVWRPFYFARLIIDPKNPDRLFKPNLQLIASEDGGRSFSNSGGRSHGDWHDLWIDPENPQHLIGGDDGGVWISFDGGSRWWKTANLPVSQFYHVSVDAKDPYQVYGGLQDNSSWVGDSQYAGGITNQRWENLYGGDGFWTLTDPTDPDAVYAEAQGGRIGRVDRRTRAMRSIQPTALYREKLRFNWNTPIAASPGDKNTLYIGAQFLFRSRDRGDTWERISPDLTTNDPEKQKQEQSGGVTVDNSSAETHTSIYSISESPKDANVIWVGTDDGNLQLTRDGGRTWTNRVGAVTGLPGSSWVSWVEASRFDAATAYAAFDRHTFGDMSPWVYRTQDFGQTWTRIIGPARGVRGYAHVIKEDVVQPSLLFCGTELGLWISIDRGTSWAEFKGGDFPSVAVRDLQIHPRESDLVLGTHGRGIWIVDDLAPLRALGAETLGREIAFLPGRPVQQRMQGRGGWAEGDATFVGENPPGGAVITYYQRSRHVFGPLHLEVLDATGKVVDSLPAGARRGINRVEWPMLLPPPRVPRAAQVASRSSKGPRFAPGAYTVRLKKGAAEVEMRLEVGLDRRAPYDAAARGEQLAAALRVHALFGRMSALVDRLEAARGGAEQRLRALPPLDALFPPLRALADRLTDLRKEIVATKEGGAITGEERIREHADELYGALLVWEGRPARYQIERIVALERELSDVDTSFEGMVAKQIRPLDAALRARGLEPIPTEVPARADAGSEWPPEARAALECLGPKGATCDGVGRGLPAEED